MRRLILLACLMAATSGLSAAVKVGDAAPPITLDRLMPDQPASNATLSALSGKAVVLEFWATWCAPCIDQIAHLNALHDQFKDRPIRFLSVTSEDPAVVESFLKKRPIAGWVGIDRSERSYKAYGFTGIPSTVLIDAQGRVMAMAHPSAIAAAHIEDLLAGRPLTLPQPRREPPMSRTGDAGPAPLVDVLIRPSASDGISTSRSEKKYTARGVTLVSLLASAYGFLPGRIEGNAVPGTGRYDVEISLPTAKSEADLQALLRQVICSTFRLKVSREMRDMDVVILTAPGGKPARLVETASTGGSLSSAGKGQLKLIGCRVATLADVVAGVIRKNVIDETGLPGRYDVQLKYDERRPESLLDAIRNDLGVQAAPARRPVEFLIASREEEADRAVSQDNVQTPR